MCCLFARPQTITIEDFNKLVANFLTAGHAKSRRQRLMQWWNTPNAASKRASLLAAFADLAVVENFAAEGVTIRCIPIIVCISDFHHHRPAIS